MDDFELWMRDRFRQGTRHLLSPLAHVVLHPVAGVVVMTAEQALRLAAWLRECAGVEGARPLWDAPPRPRLRLPRCRRESMSETVEQCPRCRTRQLGYMAWHADAERRHKAGQKQRRCPGCNLWRWPDEFRTGEETTIRRVFGTAPLDTTEAEYGDPVG